MKSLIWESKRFKSVEYCALSRDSCRFILTGSVILLRQPSMIRYQIICDKDWKTKVANIRQDSEGKSNDLELKTNTDGIWFKGKTHLALGLGLLDIDLEFSPVTNTLPINRLNLKVGESTGS